MTITLEKSLVNRQKLLSNVKEEIIGPGNIGENYKKFNHVGSTEFQSIDELYQPYYWEVGGRKEEILQRQTPTQRYVSGLLFPIKTVQDDIQLDTPIEKMPLEELDDKKREELLDNLDGIENTEDDGEVELFPQNNDYMPSTMGLTFCIDKDVPELTIKIKGGTYTPHDVRVKSDSRKYTWWLRESVEGVWNLSISDLVVKKELKTFVDMNNKDGKKINHYKIKLQARLREIKNKYIITVSITNRSDESSQKKIQSILFQSEMTINTPENHTFSIYPKQYEMKRELSKDEASTELLYRHEGIYAFGHGCAANWEQHSNMIKEISTTFIPEYEALSMSPDVYIYKNGKKEKLTIKISDLAGLSSKQHPEYYLKPLIDGYKAWINSKKKEINNIIKPLRPAAIEHMKLCEESLERMSKGLELLRNEQVLEAFQLANLAILLQQKNGKVKRKGVIKNKQIIYDKSYEENTKSELDLEEAENSWRAFQIAFILLSIESFVNENSEDREIVDLIWFPTGGGKTEAYLGVAAFQMVLRRLRNPMDAGVDVIMRYTLRLLTADQFQRSSRLICALEYIRSKNTEKLGNTPFSIGIWVGSKTTPNNNKVARSNLIKLQKNSKDAQEYIVNNCPWCGANLGYYEDTSNKKKTYWGYKMDDNNRMTIYCPDEKCHFHEELPIYIVDETIYKKRPTFLIGTVDKFVQLVWKPEARSLFGIGWDGERIVSPPSLIIQDELHLISGPLGTLTGLFEVLVEELCIKKVDNKLIKPKIIAATATIKQYEEQALALFGRLNARLFPSPGLESEDSFFATPEVDENGKPMPGRKYVGVYTQTVRLMMSQVMTFSAILQATNEIPDEEKDPYWTLLAFYNTLRELGGGLTLTQTDIPQYSTSITMRKGKSHKDTRNIYNYLELTSRKHSHEISKTIDDLKKEYKPNAKRNPSIDICLASNIIEVGVDIDRLSVMAIVGQPKMTAQYIQVSGRVGRNWWERPGLIFTIYSNTKSRDKSHFEHFREYHQKLYAQVEPTSVTPFSDSSLERGLHAIIVGYLRQALDEDIARTPDWKSIKKYENKIKQFYHRLINRAELIDPEQVETVKEMFVQTLKGFKLGNYNAWEVDPNVEGYMYPAGRNLPKLLTRKAKSMINSMRNVDSECRGLITSIYNSEIESNKEISWEDIFK